MATNDIFRGLEQDCNMTANDPGMIRLSNEVFVRYVFALVYDEAARDKSCAPQLQAIVEGLRSGANDNLDSRVIGGSTPPSIGMFARAIHKISRLLGLNEPGNSAPHIVALRELCDIINSNGLIRARNEESHQRTLPVSGDAGDYLKICFEHIFASRNPFLHGDAYDMTGQPCSHSEVICMAEGTAIRNQGANRYECCGCIRRQNGMSSLASVQVSMLLHNDENAYVLQEDFTGDRAEDFRVPSLYLRVMFCSPGGNSIRYYRLSPFFVSFFEDNPYVPQYAFFYHRTIPWQGKAVYIRMNSLGRINQHMGIARAGETGEGWFESWLDRAKANRQNATLRTMIAFPWKKLAVRGSANCVGRIIDTQSSPNGELQMHRTFINLRYDRPYSAYGEFAQAVLEDDRMYLDIPLYKEREMQKLMEVFQAEPGRQRLIIRGEGGVGKTHTVLAALRNIYFRRSCVAPPLGTMHFDYIIFLTAKKNYFVETNDSNPICRKDADFSTREQALERIAAILHECSAETLSDMLGSQKTGGSRIEKLKRAILSEDCARPDRSLRNENVLPSILLIIDDLDSMASARRADTAEEQYALDHQEQVGLVNDLFDLCQENQKLRVIMTTRYKAFSGPVDELELSALSEQQTEIFVEGFLRYCGYPNDSLTHEEMVNLHVISRGIPLYIKNLLIKRSRKLFPLDNVIPAYREQIERSMTEFSYNTLALNEHEGHMVSILAEFIRSDTFSQGTPSALVRLLMDDVDDGVFANVCESLEASYLLKRVNSQRSLYLLVRDLDSLPNRRSFTLNPLISLFLDPECVPFELWENACRTGDPNPLLEQIASVCRTQLQTDRQGVRRFAEHVLDMASHPDALGYSMLSHIQEIPVKQMFEELLTNVENEEENSWIPQMIGFFEKDEIIRANVDAVLDWLEDQRNLLRYPVESGELIHLAIEWLNQQFLPLEELEALKGNLLQAIDAYDDLPGDLPGKDASIWRGLLD